MHLWCMFEYNEYDNRDTMNMTYVWRWRHILDRTYTFWISGT